MTHNHDMIITIITIIIIIIIIIMTEGAYRRGRLRHEPVGQAQTLQGIDGDVGHQGVLRA